MSDLKQRALFAKEKGLSFHCEPEEVLWLIGVIERAKREAELLCAYFERDWQVTLHKNDVVPDAKNWLADLERGFAETTPERKRE